MRRGRMLDAVASGATGVVASLVAVGVVCLLGSLVWLGWPSLTHLITDPGAPERERFGVLLLGTAARTVLMSLAMVPAGVLTGVYLAEYAPQGARASRALRGLIRGMEGVPGIVFGVFGLGFLVGVVGEGMDRWAGNSTSPMWGRPSLMWASLTLAAMSLPPVVTASEQAFRAVPRDLRAAAMALGATRFEVLLRILLPAALPGIAIGVLLVIGRAFGEVVPLLLTGATVSPGGSIALDAPFADLAHWTFEQSRRFPGPGDGGATLPAGLWLLTFLSLSANAAAAALRWRITPTPANRG